MRKEISIRLLTDNEIDDYFNNIKCLSNMLEEIVDSDIVSELISQHVTYKLFSGNIDNKVLKKLLKSFNINKKTYNKITDIFCVYGGFIRYWTLYGRTEKELVLDLLLNDMSLKTKPLNNTIEECINLLDDIGLYNICYYYGINDKKKLKKLIMDSFDDTILTKEIYSSMKNQEFTYVFSEDDFLGGFVFSYMEDGIRHIVVPNEIMEKLDLIDYDKLPNEDIDDYLNDLKKFIKLDNVDYVMGYISMNGILEKSKLKSLIFKNHKVDISFGEIEEIVKSNDVLIYDDKYYSVIVKKDEALKLLDDKKKIKDYNVITKEICDFERSFTYLLRDYVDNKFSARDDKNDITYFIWTNLKYGSYNGEVMNDFVSEHNLNKKEIKLIDNFIKKYKDIITVWSLNGYTLKDKSVRY